MADQVKYLLSLQAIRDRASRVADVAKAGQLNHFDVREDRLDDVADLVISVIKRDYGPDKYDTIPPHGRWQHFEVGNVARVQPMLDEWRQAGCDDREVTRRLIDLFFVSVLLDAGAGDHWRYREPGPDGPLVFERSEGIAVASLHMFKAHAFTALGSSGAQIVDGKSRNFESTTGGQVFP